MSFLVRRLQIARAHVRVDLRRDEAFVAQELLHAADVGAAVEQVRGEAVAKCVGRSSLIEAGFAEVFFQHAGNAARREAGAEFIGENRRLAAGRDFR